MAQFGLFTRLYHLPYLFSRLVLTVINTNGEMYLNSRLFYTIVTSKSYTTV